MCCLGTRERYRNTVMQACRVAGDEVTLAGLLNVPVSVLVTYMLGETTIPTFLFLKAADIVLASHEKRVRDNGRWLEDFLKRHGP